MITHMFWAYGNFSRLENLCAKSFLFNGHDLHIWTYGDRTGFPSGAKIMDAREILPENLVFLNQKGSYAGFSDLFRYAVLNTVGGLYVDTDVFATKHISMLEKVNFLVTEKTETGTLKINGNVILNLAPDRGNIIDLAYVYADRFRKDKIVWGEIGPDLLTSIANTYQLHDFKIFDYKFANPYSWWEAPDCFLSPMDFERITNDCYFVHFYNEMWRRRSIDKNSIFDKKSLYEVLASTIE